MDAASTESKKSPLDLKQALKELRRNLKDYIYLPNIILTSISRQIRLCSPRACAHAQMKM